MPESRSLALARTFLGQHVELVIDRPLGSLHPRHGFWYEVNYGSGTHAPDGEALDAYFLGVTEPVLHGAGWVVAIIHRADDDDDKLVVLPSDVAQSDAEIMRAVHFQERFFESRVVR